MGYYVNPKNETKEQFLNKHGIRFSGTWKDVPEDSLPVILIDNGIFTAAGIAYQESEFKVFTDPFDSRPKEVFIVPIEKLKEVSDLSFYVK